MVLFGLDIMPGAWETAEEGIISAAG